MKIGHEITYVILRDFSLMQLTIAFPITYYYTVDRKQKRLFNV